MQIHQAIQNEDSKTKTDRGSVPLAHRSNGLGQREREILEIVWGESSATVQQVIDRLPIRLAYTTVMTTLDRLFKKGLLHRVKRDRAFVYSPAVTPGDLEKMRAKTMVERFFTGTPSSRDVLLSCLVDVIGGYDEEMLLSLEEKVKTAKTRLNLTSIPRQE